MKKIPRNNIQHLTCGIFNSNSWDRPKAYRVYSDKIESDESGNYWLQRFSKNGYQFKGETEHLSLDDIKQIGEILNEIPSKCFDLKLPSPNTPGNKDEYEIYIQIELNDGSSTQFKIDEYDQRDLKVDSDILYFKDRIKKTIKLIKEKTDNTM